MREQRATPDLAVAHIAAGQHGVVAFHQLLSAGLTSSGIARRATAGRLHLIHRGVYAVGHSALAYKGKCMAATSAVGGTAVVSHRSAAALWGLLPASDGDIQVTVPGVGGKRRRAGIRIHRSRSLTPELMTRHLGIPITKPARTIADLRRTAPAKEFRRAVRQAGVLGLPVESAVTPDRTRSDLERRFLRLCRQHGLTMPEVNVRIGPSEVGSIEVDFLWRDRQLIVETDGYRYHRGRAAFEEDRDRDLTLRTRGYEVIRLTYRQVIDDPGRVAEVLKQELRPRGDES
jgi:very-short-patch-repair endonuclease